MRTLSETLAALIRARPEGAYAVLACGLTWLITAPFWTMALGWSAWPISPHWTALGALGPLTAAALVTRVQQGPDGLRRWWRGLFARRTTLRRGFLIGLSPLALAALGLLANRLVAGGWFEPGSGIAGPDGWFDLLFVSSFAYALGEEPGWRGFLTPRLSARMGPLAVAVRVWLVWALWHAPFFLYVYPPDPLVWAGFLPSLLAGAVCLTVIWRATSGSVPIAVAWHGGFNVAVAIAGLAGGLAVAVVNGGVILAAIVIARGWQRSRDGGAHP